jgi:hypothetical protein
MEIWKEMLICCISPFHKGQNPVLFLYLTYFKLLVTVSECKDRWKNVRGCYISHLKSALQPSGSGAKLKKATNLAEYVTFLQPFTKLRAAKGSITPPPALSAEMPAEEGSSADEHADLCRENSTDQDDSS